MRFCIISLLLFYCTAVGFAQNVGIGTATPTRAGLVVNSKVGSIHAIFGENTSGVSIESAWPGIAFNNYFSSSGRRTLVSGYISGLEMNPATGKLSFYTSATASAAGGIATVASRLTISRQGNVGIGVFEPGALLHINGNMKINGANYLEFGAGISGKEVNAGKIGYALFSTDAVDIVGASVGGAQRKLRFWAEGGSRFEGPINVNTINSFNGNAADNINVNANATIVGYTKFGSTSLPLKMMTFVVPIIKQSNGLGGSWAAATITYMPLSVSNIVSYTGLSLVSYPGGGQSLFPLFGDFQDNGKGKMSMGISTGSFGTYANVRYDDCDLCDLGAKFILHIIYTDQPL